MASLHPFDPITPAEIQLAVRLLQATFPGIKLRYKRIDLQEPTKHEVIPYLEAERKGEPRPRKPARLLMALFHRLDNGSFFKALLNADTKSVVWARELPKGIQVSISLFLVFCGRILMRLGPRRCGRNDRDGTAVSEPSGCQSRD